MFGFDLGDWTRLLLPVVRIFLVVRIFCALLSKVFVFRLLLVLASFSWLLPWDGLSPRLRASGLCTCAALWLWSSPVLGLLRVLKLRFSCVFVTFWFN